MILYHTQRIAEMINLSKYLQPLAQQGFARLTVIHSYGGYPRTLQVCHLYQPQKRPAQPGVLSCFRFYRLYSLQKRIRMVATCARVADSAGPSVVVVVPSMIPRPQIQRNAAVA